jgi:hypothetical protein
MRRYAFLVYRGSGVGSGCSRVIRQGLWHQGAYGGTEWPTIKKDIDQARDQLAATVDSLAVRANPQRIADDVKAQVVGFVMRPPVLATLAGVGVVAVVLVIRRIRRR